MRRDEVAIWLAQHDPDPCDPIEFDAAAYYRDFAAALIGSGWQITPIPTDHAHEGESGDEL